MEPKFHRSVLLLKRPNVLPELLVDLADHPVQPVLHIGVGEFDLFAHLDRLVVEFLRGLDLDVELVDLRVGGAATLNLDVGLLVLHLQLVQFFRHLLVLVPQHVQLLLIIRHSLKQLTVGRLPREELLNDLLHIGEASLRSDLLESLLNLRSTGHLFVHFRLQKSAPELLCEEILIHFELI